MRSSIQTGVLVFVLTAAPASGVQTQVLVSPKDGTSHVSSKGVYLEWTSHHDKYEVFLSQDSLSLMSVASGITESFVFSGDLENQRTYFWRVVGVNAGGVPDTSAMWSFTVSDTATLKVRRFAPSASSLDYDTELDSRNEFDQLDINLSRTALVVLDVWDVPEVNPGILANIQKAIEIARSHGIEVVHMPHGGNIHPLVSPRPWEIVHETGGGKEFDEILRQKGINTLLYTGFDASECILVSRPNSISMIWQRHLDSLRIVGMRDGIGSWAELGYLWGINCIETRFQSSEIAELALSLGDTVTVAPYVFPVIDITPDNFDHDLGVGIDPSKTAVVIVNPWANHENDGWAERMSDNNLNRIKVLLEFARAKKIQIVYVANGREIDSRLLPQSGDYVFATKYETWTYLKNSNHTFVLFAGEPYPI